MRRLAYLLSFVSFIHLVAFTAVGDSQVPKSATTISMVDSETQVATWEDSSGKHYGIKRGESDWHIVENTSYNLKLRFAEFDPAVAVPQVPLDLSIPAADAIAGQQVYIVQFQTQAIEEYRRDIEQIGGTLHKFLANHSYLVRLTNDQKTAIEKLEYVRWVGVFQPAYKIDETLLNLWAANSPDFNLRFNIMVHQRGPIQKAVVVERIKELGGRVHAAIDEGFILEATLNRGQVNSVASMAEVAWMDLWSEREEDMNNVRNLTGANFIESVAGYTGQGVRGEVMDTNLFANHIDFQNMPPIFHGPREGGDDHGTGTYGITFGDGTGNASARGMLPSGQGIFADYHLLNNRYNHTSELTQAPYFAVFQSNSWGNTPTTSYNSLSSQMDDIIFDTDLIITQSQSNQNSQLSRPQAWAKNIVAVGGINHRETLTKNDDFWGGASIGPASDGRVKPDLCHAYDTIFTVDDTSGGYRNFCCTSGATPIVAGHFGIFFQMWSEGLFGNEVEKNGTVFDNRPHSTTARAMVINNACSYGFNGTGANLTRTHQGWGMPDLQRIYEMRLNTFVVNEEIPLQNLDSAQFLLTVPSSTPEFRATLVYLDPPGTTNSSQHRINDLSLRVTAPNGTTYWGNNGLLAGNFSTPGGAANTIDTIENVFVQSPATGTWTVEVIATEVNEDSHVETPVVDADFALVVTGVETIATTLDEVVVSTGTLVSGDLQSIEESDDVALVARSVAPSTDSPNPLVVRLTGTLNDDSPNAFQITMESQANTVGLDATVEMFDYENNVFVDIGSDAISYDEDSALVVSVTENAANYAEPVTGRFTVLVKINQQSPALVFPWDLSIDRLSVTAN